MHLSRRGLMTATAGLAASATLTACANTTAAGVASDISLLINGLSAAVPQIISIAHVDPQTATDLQTYLANAEAAAAAVSSGLAASGSSTAQMFASAVNNILNVAASIPLIPPPFNMVIQAAAVLLPVIERALGLVATRRAVPTALTPEAARLILRSAAAR